MKCCSITIDGCICNRDDRGILVRSDERCGPVVLIIIMLLLSIRLLKRVVA